MRPEVVQATHPTGPLGNGRTDNVYNLRDTSFQTIMLSSILSHASDAPSEASFDPFTHLPEEIVLGILLHLERLDLLSVSCTSRTMNRLAIQLLLSASDIAKPTSYCKLVLDPSPKTTIDPLMVLLHSVHIREINDLTLYFTRFHTYSALAQPLRRALRLLRSLTCATEVTFFFGSKGKKEPKDEKHFKEMVSIFQLIFNETIIKSCKKIRVFGAEGLLSQYYQFHFQEYRGSSRKLFSGVKFKDYLDRRQDKNSDDPIVLADLRYTRTNTVGSRIFLHCSPEALSKTQLTHLNFGTADFLRPPFSQWTFSMLKASNVQSLSFAFSHLPSDIQEVDFILQRLAAVLPNLNRLYLFDIKPTILPILIKWINMFPSLRTLQIEPFTYICDDIFTQLQAQSPSSHPDASGQFSFVSYLRRIDAPHQFLTYFFAACGPSLPGANQARFPALDMVHLDYFCIRGVSLDIAVLANALKRIRPLFTSSVSTTAIVVHLKFDRTFLGLTPSLCEGLVPEARQDDAAELAFVDKVRLGLPGTRDEIMQGKFDDKILGCLSLFSGMKYLRLASTEHTSRLKEELSSLRSQVFKARNPSLRRVDIL